MNKYMYMCLDFANLFIVVIFSVVFEKFITYLSGICQENPWSVSMWMKQSFKHIHIYRVN